MIEYFSNAGLPFLNPPILVSLVYPLFLNFELPAYFFKIVMLSTMQPNPAFDNPMNNKDSGDKIVVTSKKKL